MSFRDFQKIVQPMVLPINGKGYTVPFLSIPAANRLREQIAPSAASEPMADLDFCRLMLGDAFDEMAADDVPSAAMSRAAVTALADFQRGRVVAEVVWEAGDDTAKATAALERRLAVSPSESPAEEG